MLSSLAFLSWKVADTCNVDRYRCAAPELFQIQEPKSLTLHWRSFLGDSRNVVPSCLPRKAANTPIMSETNYPAFGLSKMQDKKLLTICWRSFLGMAMSITLVLLNRKTSNTVTLSGCDYVAVWLQNVKDYESSMLRWHSHYTEPNCHSLLNNCSPSVCWNYWQPIFLVYVLYFASRCFVTPHHLIHYFMRDMSNKWQSHITFQRFRPAINGMQTQPLIVDQYRLTVPPFLIQLLFLDFHDLP